MYEEESNRFSWPEASVMPGHLERLEEAPDYTHARTDCVECDAQLYRLPAVRTRSRGPGHLEKDEKW